MLETTLIPWAVLALVVSLLWKRTKAFILKSPLDRIPGPKSQCLAKGNIAQISERNAWSFLDHLTDDYQPIVKLNGLFGKRVLWVFDPKALTHVILRDQDVYEERASSMIFRRLAFGPGLFSTDGDHHRRQRKLLNPVFSIAHMRHLTPIFYETAHRLAEGVKNQLKTSQSNEVDILAWMGRTALELIGRGGFGHSFDPLLESKSDAYADAVKDFVPTSARLNASSVLMLMSRPFAKVGDRYPAFRRVLRHAIPWIPFPALQDMKKLVDTLDDTSREIYKQKKLALVGGNEELKIGVEEGRDLMGVLLRANMEASEEDRLPEEEIIAQMSSFTFAGTDTTSNGIARIVHLLCLHPEVQERLRKEIVEARSANGGHDISYDELVELPYLDAICRETLRLYPPVPFMGREAKKDSVLPFSQPVSTVDGSAITSVLVPKGTTVFVAIYSCNRNKAIWGDDATEWKPERWLGDGVPKSVTDAKIPGVYSNLMTFLGGGRACIGFKFSQLEMKVVLSDLLSSFRLSLADGDIVWNRAGVSYPSTHRSGAKPSMPVKMELL
ncbi:hypothetical protein PHLGIDRAFT_414123 [Phlebiopsis gigantea 11061_1 CR5-6]|uniref:Cytochrome P450 n=1 Tax=Phlebiopsis gigantea (strain 11061_1 CR5-6) TaxID=745531 RepID=A0A0C3SB12_PHLG1|nr:hypothetical protein PHLGIDRAFT_414123 [Phlebiopsis gigantea 11061_1 CR5-6]